MRTINKLFYFLMIGAMVSLCFTACQKDDDGESGRSGKDGNSKKEKYISSDEQAAQIARYLWFALNDIDNQLSTGTFNNTPVYSPLSGQATVNGTVSSYTGSYMNTVQTDSRLTITFDNYVIADESEMYSEIYNNDSNGYTITGTITYRQDKYSSSKYKLIREVNGDNIEIEGNGIKDVMSVDLDRYHNSKTKNDKKFPLAGSIVSSSGSSYSAYDGWEQ